MREFHPKDIERLGNVCALLASPYDGERAAAALLASRTLSAYGIGWKEFVMMAFEDKQTEQKYNYIDEAAASRVHVYSVLLEWDMLTEWERGFVLSLQDREPRTPTKRQDACLSRIVARYNLYND